jgi:hypothetical protein
MTTNQIEAMITHTQEQYSRYVELAQITDLAGIAAPSDPEFAAPLPAPLGLSFSPR